MNRKKPQFNLKNPRLIISLLPIDILTEILLKLPAKSLLRFKCVCKSWYDLISDYDFINRHVDQCNMHIIFRTPSVYMSDFDTFDNPRTLNYPFKNWEDGCRIVGSCRGLICFSTQYYPYTIFLYNPTTQTHKILPRLPVMSTFYYPKGHSYVGFGYDYMSEDYKCVKIFLRKSDDGVSFKSQVMVYSLRDDTWKRGAHDVPYYVDHALACYGYCVSLGGIVHWSIEGDHREPLPIFGFNLSDETFSSVPLPNYHAETLYEYKRAHIGVLDGCLCVILNCWDHSDVWIMKEYGIVTSWTRLCRVKKPQQLRDLRPLFFLKNRKELLVLLTLGNVASLDLETLKTTNVQPPGFNKLWSAYACLENLLVFKDVDHIPMGKHQYRNRNTKLRKLLMRKTERIIRFNIAELRATLEMYRSRNEES